MVAAEITAVYPEVSRPGTFWSGLRIRIRAFVTALAEITAETRRLREEASRRYPHLGAGF